MENILTLFNGNLFYKFLFPFMLHGNEDEPLHPCQDINYFYLCLDLSVT